jgi:hypothetical protein
MKFNSRRLLAVLLIVSALLALGVLSNSLLRSRLSAIAQPASSGQTPEAGIAYPNPTLSPNPYPPASSGTPYPPPSVDQYQPTPYPIGTMNPTEAARIAEKQTGIAVLAMTMTAEPSPTPRPTVSAEQRAANLERMKNMMKSVGAIMLEDNGNTFTYSLSERFFVFLDDEKYPRSELVCEPKPVIGYISNGDFRGPDLYPIYYEASEIGSCTLKDRDFAIKIVVKDLPTVPAA